VPSAPTRADPPGGTTRYWDLPERRVRTLHRLGYDVASGDADSRAVPCEALVGPQRGIIARASTSSSTRPSAGSTPNVSHSFPPERASPSSRRPCSAGRASPRAPPRAGVVDAKRREDARVAQVDPPRALRDGGQDDLGRGAPRELRGAWCRPPTSKREAEASCELRCASVSAAGRAPDRRPRASPSGSRRRRRTSRARRARVCSARRSEESRDERRSGKFHGIFHSR